MIKIHPKTNLPVGKSMFLGKKYLHQGIAGLACGRYFAPVTKTNCLHLKGELSRS
jgi:hypothetical protein